MPASVPEVLEKGTLSEVFYRGRMASQCKLQEQIFVSWGKMLIIATINYSDMFLRDNQVHRCKNIALIGERDEIIWDFRTCLFGFSCSTGRLLY